jgi:hypothetical protein
MISKTDVDNGRGLWQYGLITKNYIMEKDLNYWKKNAEEDYMKVPISVLRYITELEKGVLPQADVIKSVCDKCGNEKRMAMADLCDKCFYEGT